jgi:hypothetical protein
MEVFAGRESLSRMGYVCMSTGFARDSVRWMARIWWRLERWTGLFLRLGVRPRRVATLVLIAAIAAAPTVIRAQQEDESAGGSFAGGQMVRGVVAATSADKLTLKTEAGVVYQVALSANTRVTRNRQPVKAAEIKVGDGIGAMGVMDPPTKTIHAVFVGVIDAEQVKKAKEDLGKVYIAGKITAIDMDALKLTVMRPDGVSQVIGVDEQTSFKRGGRGMAALVNGSGDVAASGSTAATGGESITLADVKVGDSVAGRGALKSGTFVPTELSVMDASMRRGRRRAGADAGGSAAPSSTAPQP